MEVAGSVTHSCFNSPLLVRNFLSQVAKHFTLRLSCSFFLLFLLSLFHLSISSSTFLAFIFNFFHFTKPNKRPTRKNNNSNNNNNASSNHNHGLGDPAKTKTSRSHGAPYPATRREGAKKPEAPRGQGSKGLHAAGFRAGSGRAGSTMRPVSARILRTVACSSFHMFLSCFTCVSVAVFSFVLCFIVLWPF